MKKTVETIKKQMETCKTMEELKQALKQAFKALHPDNNLDNMQEAQDAFIFIRQIYDACRLRIAGHKPSKKLEQEVQRRNEMIKIRRVILSADEFFSMPGEEQIAVLKGCSARVAIVLDGMTPTPNAKQITDKHHADKSGNFDGMRSYAFVQYVFTKNRTINQERLEEVAQSAWVKLAENTTKEKYQGIPFYSLLWISCRQAMFNLYYAEVKHDSYLDREHDLFDTEAYESKAPTGSQPEAVVIPKIWLSAFLQDKTDRTVYRMSRQGYTEQEIGEQLDMSQYAVSKRLQKIYDRIQEDRLLEALNTTADKAGCRRNASAREIVRALIMQAIKQGMTYRRIAGYLHCGADDIPKMLQK